MELYKILSVLLSYPEPELVESVDEIKSRLRRSSFDTSSLFPLLSMLKKTELIELQEKYVQTFDHTSKNSLHLFEHLHGEDPVRGQALVDLLNEYEQFQVTPIANELPDYLPMFLEYLSMNSSEQAQILLGEAVHVIAHIKNNLAKSNSPYVSIFNLLLQLSPVSPQPLKAVPARDMDEMMESVGANDYGIEPLAAPLSSTAYHPIHFGAHLQGEQRKGK